MFEPGIFLAALGITVLELAEAGAVGVALYAQSRSHMAFVAVSLGVLVVFVPTALVGKYIGLLPEQAVRLVGGTLLLYFGIRLTRSARRSYIRSKRGAAAHEEGFERGVLATGFGVGAVEAFEAAIVLVALLPNSYYSAMLGLLVGVALVVAFTYMLRLQVRRVKQANIKILVAALLLSFATFWFAEEAVTLPDLVLLPLFLLYVALVRWLATRGTQKLGGVAQQDQETQTTTQK